MVNAFAICERELMSAIGRTETDAPPDSGHSSRCPLPGAAKGSCRPSAVVRLVRKRTPATGKRCPVREDLTGDRLGLLGLVDAAFHGQRCKETRRGFAAGQAVAGVDSEPAIIR